MEATGPILERSPVSSPAQSSSDAALLALVIDDPLATRVLAWWKVNSGPIEAAEARAEECGNLIGVETFKVRLTMRRCVQARLLTEEGISDIADRFLLNWVAQHLTAAKRGKKS
jgi:hypothetical protein